MGGPVGCGHPACGDRQEACREDHRAGAARIQARTMKNFRQWRQNGFPASPSAEEARLNWLADQDSYHRFAEEVIEKIDDGDAYVLPARVWDAWQLWKDAHGVRLEI